MKAFIETLTRGSFLSVILGGLVFVLIFPTWEDSKFWPPIDDLEFGVPMPWLRWNVHYGLDGITSHGWRPVFVDVALYILLSLISILTIEWCSSKTFLRETKETCLVILIVLSLLTIILFNEAFSYSVLLGVVVLFDSPYYGDTVWWTLVYLVVPVVYLSAVSLFARCFSNAWVAGVIIIIGGTVLVLSYALNNKGWL